MTKPFRIWVFASVCACAIATSLWLFFMISSFGFVHMTTLHWLGFACGVNLLVALTIWLCREKLRTRGAKIALSVASGLLGFVAAWLFFIVSLFMALGGTTVYQRYTISRSPQGTNRMIVYVTGFDRDMLVASPMVNGWMYRRGQTHWLFARGFTPQVEWLDEYRARVRLLSDGGEELDLPDGTIMVEFDF